MINTGKDVIKPYTPVSGDEKPGAMDLVVKVYDQGKVCLYVSICVYMRLCPVVKVYEQGKVCLYVSICVYAVYSIRV